MLWVDISYGMRGWFAILMSDDDCPNVPNVEQSSPITCRNREEAILDARRWVASEGIRVASDLIKDKDS